MIAKTISHYEILEKLGAGGMGEVYCARDTRLDRKVAIKVLAAHLAGDDKARHRLEREARAIASLQHPHICTLYDIGHEPGIDFLVMEYLEGETLAKRLQKGALPLDQVLRLGIEIAEGLEKAHRSGLVHRDLKPANIMLTKSGAKLMDFGLAKAVEAPSPLATTTASLVPGGTPLTAEGTLVGTLQYMSPEQVEGKEADARSDIFALGSVLYEMVTGRRAFDGKSSAAVIAAILQHEPPPVSTLQPSTPLALDRAVKKCLAKDPDERWQTAHDLKDEFQWIAGAPQEAGLSQRTDESDARSPLRRRLRLAWALTAVFGALAALALAYSLLHRSPTASRVARFTIPLPENSTLTGTTAVSPDGRYIAYTATDSSGKDQLWIRPLESLSSRTLPATEDARFPFWSPDSQLIGFFAAGKLKTIAISGGPPRSLCDVSDARGAAWSKEGVIVLAPSSGSGLYSVPAAGGPLTPVTTRDSTQESSHRWPIFLPDGRHFIYLVLSARAEIAGLYLGSLDSKDKKRLVNTEKLAGFSPPGYLLFVREQTLMAQPFDLRQMQLTGEAVPVAESLWSDPSAISGLVAFSVSEDGVLAYRGGGEGISRLVWFDRSGRSLGSVGSPGSYSEPALSPDGKRLLVTYGSDVSLIDLPTGATTRFTFSSGEAPAWSSDGRLIAFSSNRNGNWDLYQKLASGGAEEPLLMSNNPKFPDDWSADGRYVTYDNETSQYRIELWVLPRFGDQKPRPYLHADWNELHGRFSPNGKWMAYTSNESGRYEVYVTGFPEPRGKWQVSTSGGFQPCWRRDGKELYYLASDRKLMAVEVKTDSASFEAGGPVPLFQTRVEGDVADARGYYAASADGRRFLVVTPTEETLSSPINVVLNWTADLKK